MTEKKPTSPKSICVFCGSSGAVEQSYLDLASETGEAIGRSEFRLVYGGGGVGLMGATAKAAHKAGGDVLGIIPEFLKSREGLYVDVPHQIVPDMHTRKRNMYAASDAFIVLPGGIGTLEETIEVISWLRLGLHAKPVIFLDNDGYYVPLLSLIKHTSDAKFTPDWLNDFLYHAETPDEAVKLVIANIGRHKPANILAKPEFNDVVPPTEGLHI
ncbi:LOG family protein [Robiginitomaculum antarcticum]|uniref:LOG family protein n=1 Tax=Robiginitomaculum antarcticum TaxID=437507 RepID=UPI0003670FA8|nr:TIGR00730 family Rossman fold protein [Robiginitomaculum antarcticum]